MKKDRKKLKEPIKKQQEDLDELNSKQYKKEVDLVYSTIKHSKMQ